MAITYTIAFSVFRRLGSVFWQGGDREKQVKDCLKLALDAKDSNRLVRMESHVSFSLPSVSLADPLFSSPDCS